MTGPRFIDRYSPDNVASDPDGRLHAPAFERNAEPIRAVLADLLGPSGIMLEIGSGTGQHAAYMAGAFPAWRWVPTECDAAALGSIEAWRRAKALPNLMAPERLDASGDWSADPVCATLAPDAIFTANVVHIAPWSVAEGIVAGAGRLLGRGGMLIFYGPFRQHGQHTGRGNEAFDAALRARDPEWGVRAVEDVARLAESAGFGPPRIVGMPSDNRILAFTRG